MTETGFVKAQSDNLPKIDVFMMSAYFASNLDFTSAEIKGVKAASLCHYNKMNKWSLIVLGACATICLGREPFKPYPGTIPFMVNFASRYRGVCMGTLVSRVAVLTAAVCIINPRSAIPDTRPINVVVGSTYRHPRRGIRVQVTKVILPKLPEELSERVYLLSRAAAIMLLKRKVPDILVEVPLRGLEIDYRGESVLMLQEKCLIVGWHFFFKGDKIYPGMKFLLQRNLRAQFVNIVKLFEWCDPLVIKLKKAMVHLGYDGFFEDNNKICIKDPDNIAQACHGMYGSPLICKGRQVGILIAPDAQWVNCTGLSNVIHLLSASYHSSFFSCVSRLFTPEFPVKWEFLKKAIEGENNEYDYIPAIYDRVTNEGSSDSDE